MFWIAVIIVIALAYFIFFSKTGKRLAEEHLAKEKKTKVEYEGKIIAKFQEENIEVSLQYRLEHFNVLAVDEINKRVCYLENKYSNNYKSMEQVRFEAHSYDYKDILASEVIIDGETVTKTSRSSQLGGALIGAALTGGVGAIIGGLSGVKTSQEKVQKVQLKLIVNDIKNPIVLISFLDSPRSISKKDEKYLKAEKDVQNMHGLFVLLIDIADKDDRAMQRNISVKEEVVESLFTEPLSPISEIIKVEKHSEVVIPLEKAPYVVSSNAVQKEILFEEDNNFFSESQNKNFSAADEIRKLHKLFSEGIITEDEFNNQKKKILS